jgi:hypothetical protein
MVDSFNGQIVDLLIAVYRHNYSTRSGFKTFPAQDWRDLRQSGSKSPAKAQRDKKAERGVQPPRRKPAG